jgi:hypothetical protein
MADTAQYRNGEVYQNYPVRTLEGWETAYFKGGYARLQAVKKAYDPGDFFRFQQGIVPAADAGGIVVEAGPG